MPPRIYRLRKISSAVTDTIEGTRELNRARSKDSRFRWVLVCELPSALSETADRYVVWYEDKSGRCSVGYYTTRYEGARAEFKRRTGV